MSAGDNSGDGLPDTVNDSEDISHLDDEERQYLASWKQQTKKRMEYPKVKAMIAAQRFKNLIANKTETPESEPEPEPEPEPVETPPPVAPPKKRRRRRKEAAGFRDIDLVYIEPGGPLPGKWKKRPNEDPSEKLKAAQLEQWQREFALRFLEKSWGDPYFARTVMLDMNTKMRLRNQDISRQKRQIMEMQRDHMIMKDYITELEDRNGRLKKNYFRGIPKQLEAIPIVPFETATREERRAIGDRLKLIDEIRFLREKQFVDKEVLKDYSRRLGGHVTRPDIEAVRQLVPSAGAASYVPRLDEVHTDLKDKYFMLKESIDRQDADLRSLEEGLKNTHMDAKTLSSLQNSQRRNDEIFEDRSRRFREERQDPVLDYYRNYRSLMEDPRLPYIREAMHREYQKSKLKTRIDHLDKEISSFKRENISNSKLNPIR